jgi:hypothetical protein
MPASKPPEGFTELQQQAFLLKQRILSGESIPLDDLKSFLLSANGALDKQRQEREKPTDIDFF